MPISCFNTIKEFTNFCHGKGGVITVHEATMMWAIWSAQNDIMWNLNIGMSLTFIPLLATVHCEHRKHVKLRVENNSVQEVADGVIN